MKREKDDLIFKKPGTWVALKIIESQDEDRWTIHLKGRLGGMSEFIGNTILDLYKKNPADLQVNFKEVDYISSSNIASLIWLADEMATGGHTLTLLSPSTMVARAFHESNLDRVIEIRGEA